MICARSHCGGPGHNCMHVCVTVTQRVRICSASERICPLHSFAQCVSHWLCHILVLLKCSAYACIWNLRVRTNSTCQGNAIWKLCVFAFSADAYTNIAECRRHRGCTRSTCVCPCRDNGSRVDNTLAATTLIRKLRLHSPNICIAAVHKCYETFRRMAYCELANNPFHCIIQNT